MITALYLGNKTGFKNSYWLNLYNHYDLAEKQPKNRTQISVKCQSRTVNGKQTSEMILDRLNFFIFDTSDMNKYLEELILTGILKEKFFTNILRPSQASNSCGIITVEGLNYLAGIMLKITERADYKKQVLYATMLMEYTISEFIQQQNPTSLYLFSTDIQKTKTSQVARNAMDNYLQRNADHVIINSWSLNSGNNLRTWLFRGYDKRYDKRATVSPFTIEHKPLEKCSKKLSPETNPYIQFNIK